MTTRVPGPLLGVLSLALVGCTYPRLVEQGKVDEEALARIARGTAEAIDVPSGAPIPHEILSPEAARAHVNRAAERDLAPDEARRRARSLEALGLLPPGVDLRAAYADLAAREAAAFYDPDTKTFYLIDRESHWTFASWLFDRDLEGELVASHELVHALRDRRTPLRGLQVAAEDDDEEMAIAALIEGDAVLGSLRYLGRVIEHPELEEELVIDRATLLEHQDEALERAPAYLREILLFPYWAGPRWIKAERRAGRDPWVTRPRTTRAVLHPELAPVASSDSVLLEPREPPEGATLLRENVLGELGLSVLVGLDAARGWTGDHYRAYETPAGALALVWALRFETGEQATRVGAALDARPRRAAVRRVGAPDARTLTIVEAPDEATADALSPTLAPGDRRVR